MRLLAILLLLASSLACGPSPPGPASPAPPVLGNPSPETTWGRLTAGMSPEQVRDILGPPAEARQEYRRERGQIHGGPESTLREVWTYPGGGEVYFELSRVTGFRPPSKPSP